MKVVEQSRSGAGGRGVRAPKTASSEDRGGRWEMEMMGEPRSGEDPRTGGWDGLEGGPPATNSAGSHEARPLAGSRPLCVETAETKEPGARAHCMEE